MNPTVALTGWFGSDNLGDELILRALVEALAVRGADAVAVSIRPEATRELHGTEAMAHRPVVDRRLVRMLRRVGAMGVAGGIIQDETSPWNVPFHTSRLRAAHAAGATVGAVGLGVGELQGRVARLLARRALGAVSPLVVRDRPSAQRLGALGVEGVVVGADPVLGREVEPVTPTDTFCVVLRPPNRRGFRTAAAKAGRTGDAYEARLAGLAEAVAEVAAATGLTPRLVAFQASRDGVLHDAVAQRLRVPVELVTPTVETVLGEVGRSRFVVTMRYHGAVGALLHGRPAVLLDYSPKMGSLAAEGHGWAPTVDPNRLTAATLAAVATDAMGRGESRIAEALAALRARLHHNENALDLLVDAAAARC